jgi:hypothetical protein
LKKFCGMQDCHAHKPERYWLADIRRCGMLRVMKGIHPMTAILVTVRNSASVVLLLLALAAAPAGAQTWTAPATVTTGQLMTASFWNDNVRDNLSVLRAGGVAVSSQAIGDLLCASSTTQFARLAGVATGQVLASGGTGTCPAYTSVLSLGLSTSHTLTGSANSQQRLRLNNDTDGTAARSTLDMEAGGSVNAVINTFAESFTTSGLNIPATVLLSADGTAVALNLYASAVTGKIGFFTGGSSTEAARIHASRGVSIGDITDPGATNLRVAGTITSVGQPGFLAYSSATQNGQVHGATVVFGTEIYDELGNFASNTFTAPVAGRYLFTVAVKLSNGSADHYRGIQLVTSNRSYHVMTHGRIISSESTPSTLTLSVVADMDASDTAHVTIHVETGTVGIVGQASGTEYDTFFSGRLLP